MEATFKQSLNSGVDQVDHTPGSAIAIGQVVVIAGRPYVAHRAIAAGVLGALAMRGGIYSVTAAGALSAGARVYWDNSANKVTSTASGNTVFGFVAPHSSAAADGDAVLVIHCPDWQGQAANVAALTDNTGGTGNDALTDVGSSFNQATLNNNFADLGAKLNAVLTALKNAGLMATS